MTYDRREVENTHFREKKATPFRALSTICKSISVIASVAGDDFSLAFSPSIDCLGAISHLINAVDGVL